MPPKNTLTDVQKLEFCRFANENKMTRKKQLTAEINNPNKRRNRSVTVPQFELALKEFILTYQHQNSQEIEETDELLNLSDSIENLNLPNSMKVDDFLAIPEEEVVCEILDENSLMVKIIEIFKEKPEESDNEDSDEADDSVETTIINTSEALKSLEVMCIFLLQQEES
ncbi:10770_t:CDS:2, partial [Dentiscutata heterogama]